MNKLKSAIKTQTGATLERKGKEKKMEKMERKMFEGDVSYTVINKTKCKFWPISEFDKVVTGYKIW